MPILKRKKDLKLITQTFTLRQFEKEERTKSNKQKKLIKTRAKSCSDVPEQCLDILKPHPGPEEKSVCRILMFVIVIRSGLGAEAYKS